MPGSVHSTSPRVDRQALEGLAEGGQRQGGAAEQAGGWCFVAAEVVEKALSPVDILIDLKEITCEVSIKESTGFIAPRMLSNVKPGSNILV